MSKHHSIRDYRLLADFQLLRETLLHARFSDHWQRPLAYWVLPGDRRLPLALLDRPLGELLESSFENLLATPGVGETKLRSMLKLLDRIKEDDESPTPPEPPRELERPTQGFDPAIVSDALWSIWRETVRAHGLQRETLGRLAPSLQRLPTVIWSWRFEDYIDLSLEQIRGLRAHGEKRVTSVLEVFHTAHLILGATTPNGQFTVRIAPRFVAIVEDWIDRAVSDADSARAMDVRDQLVFPLLNQVELDLGETIHRLAADRLGIEAPPPTVRVQAERLGVTRARVYQLLDQCAQAMEVRWPTGRMQLARVESRLRGVEGASDALRLTTAAGELFFPTGKDDGQWRAEGARPSRSTADFR